MAQYAPSDNQTPMEKRYLAFLENEKEPEVRKQKVGEILKIHDVTRNDHLNVIKTVVPNGDFILAYNERAEKENKEIRKKQSRQMFNEEGKKFARQWENKGFNDIHDPLSKIYLFY